MAFFKEKIRQLFSTIYKLEKKCKESSPNNLFYMSSFLSLSVYVFSLSIGLVPNSSVVFSRLMLRVLQVCIFCQPKSLSNGMKSLNFAPYIFYNTLFIKKLQIFCFKGDFHMSYSHDSFLISSVHLVTSQLQWGGIIEKKLMLATQDCTNTIWVTRTKTADQLVKVILSVSLTPRMYYTCTVYLNYTQQILK